MNPTTQQNKLKTYLLIVLTLLFLFQLITYKAAKSQNIVGILLRPHFMKTKTEYRNNSKKHSKIYTISFFTRFYEDQNEWRFFQTKNDYIKECGYALRNCRYNYNRSDWRDSDLVFFHGRDMPKKIELEKMKKLGKPGQLWVYFIMESTIYTPGDYHTLNHLFELVSSYRPTSDMFNPYGYYEALTHEEKVNASKININYAEGKTKQIYWVVSHCGRPREKLVKLLGKYGLEIDVGGHCRNQHRRQINKPTLKNKQNLKAYKFYLSFENSFCSDYITEKYWHTPFTYGNVPIMLSGANYHSNISIPGSFINAYDFNSPKELAEYIKKVASNDTLYNQYFEWKKHYKVYQNYLHTNGCAKSMDLFCQKLHTGIHLRKDALLNDINKTRECDEQTKHYDSWINK